MNGINLRLEGMLSFIENSGAEGFDDSKIEELERIILDCNSLMTKTYTDQVADSIYDTLYDMLKTVKPDSEVLQNIWEPDGDISDYTDLLQSHPMMSIETAKSYDCQAITGFIDRMPNESTSYFASYKINGHGIRIVYKDGELVSATSRARSSGGKDLTRHMKILLGERNENIAEYGLVEFRGELCLRLDRLEEARSYNPEIKSAFSAVASLSRPSATEEEIKLLDFLCYGMIVEDFYFNERQEEFNTIEELGFNVPQYALIDCVSKDELLETMVSVVQSFEETYEEFGYFCDGVVFEINDRVAFDELGQDGNHNLGNIALKVGVWEQDKYCGFIQTIIWTKGKTKLSPVAIVADEPDMILMDDDGVILNYDDLGVISAQGNRVRRVPLYNPKNIIILDAYEGEPIYFKYGSESGVVPCFPDGRLLSEDAASDLVAGVYDYDTEGSTDDFIL